MPGYEYRPDKDRRACEERRFFEERSRCDENDDYERPKKKRCDDDHKEDRCHHCPDWCKCPPPWWFWPQEDKKDDDHKKDKRRDETELAAFGYMYVLSTATTAVLPNADVVFTNNGVLEDITHSPTTPQVIIRKSGIYQVYYGVNAVSGAGGLISLAVNGSVDPITTVSIASVPSETSGKVLLSLRSGDILTLRNSSAITTITLAAAPVVGAQLTLERIGNLDRKRDD